MDNRKVFPLVLFVITGLVFGLGFWRQWPSDQARVVFCNVGQGDAILIEKGTTQAVIDGGPGSKVLECLQTYMPAADTTVELMVSTHPDADHLTGLVAVLKKYQVKQIWVEDRVTNTKTFFRFRNEILEEKKQGAVVAAPKLGDIFHLNSNISLTVLFPFQPIVNETVFFSTTTETQLSALATQQKKQFGATNYGSIAIKLTIGEVSFLFTGDLEEQQEIALINKGVLTHNNVLKAGHHVSKTSNSVGLLQIVQPETVIISLGKNNSYGHPHKEVLSHFQKVGAHVHRTDTEGNIEVVSDGHTYWITLH
jgi:competence protein ComEC